MTGIFPLWLISGTCARERSAHIHSMYIAEKHTLVSLLWLRGHYVVVYTSLQAVLHFRFGKSHLHRYSAADDKH